VPKKAPAQTVAEKAVIVDENAIVTANDLTIGSLLE
jgi:hypothetical protein